MKTVLIQKQSSVELLLLSREDGVNSVYRGHRQVNCFSRKDRKDLRIPPSHSRQQWSAARGWNSPQWGFLTWTTKRQRQRQKQRQWQRQVTCDNTGQQHVGGIHHSGFSLEGRAFDLARGNCLNCKEGTSYLGRRRGCNRFARKCGKYHDKGGVGGIDFNTVYCCKSI